MRYFVFGLLGLAIMLNAAYFLGPREPVHAEFTFQPTDLGIDLDRYLFQREADVPNLVRGAQKYIAWNNPAVRGQTEYAIVYLHGFSATSHEIRPVPELVAKTLGANVFYTRLQGHGRDGEAMAEGTVPGWMNDVAEALEIGQRIGRKTIVIGTSTGGTLATLAAFDPRLQGKIDALVLVSPNFKVQAAGGMLLNLPYARQFVPLILGRERAFIPINPDHAKWWTEKYPTTALIPMAAAVSAANSQPFEAAEHPALFVFSDADQVVSATRTRQVAARWGSDATLFPLEMAPGDDPASHVVTGDIMSPNQTDKVANRILQWIEAVPGL